MAVGGGVKKRRGKKIKLFLTEAALFVRIFPAAILLRLARGKSRRGAGRLRPAVHHPKGGEADGLESNDTVHNHCVIVNDHCPGQKQMTAPARQSWAVILTCSS
ncbi:MAG: hypothetical protein FWE80_01525 [Oscillospiraceae bacterium]|nr:hypothetical protein [Oscillospiraceae bacterium]